MQLIYAPTITPIAWPTFHEPPHLPVRWLGPSTGGERLAEYAGRLCYMSQQNPASRTTADYLANIRKEGHGSVLEHSTYSYLIEGVSRSLTHELVRHRAGFAYSQLSQRYVDAVDVAMVVPPAYIGHADLLRDFEFTTLQQLEAYKRFVEAHPRRPNETKRQRKQVREAARSVLPNATETKLVMTGNVRAWRHVLALRGSEHADREIRRLAVCLLRVLLAAAPAFFQDIGIYQDEDGQDAVRSAHPKV